MTRINFYLYKKRFESIVGKGENAGNQHFVRFPQCFLPILKQISISVTFILLSANAFNLDQSKILLFGKKLTLYQTTKLYTCLNWKHSQTKKWMCLNIYFFFWRIWNIVVKENAG